MKLVTVVGARPQFIKAAALSRQVRSMNGVQEVLVHTGQHYDDNMSDVFFRELGLPGPVVNLGIGSGRHGAQTGRMLEGLEEVLLTERPDWLVIYGDTNSTLAAALAGVKLHIPVAHVEAGLRSFNRRMPEEVNRVLSDHASELLFAPTAAAVGNLTREGITPERIQLVGDVMYDVALAASDVADRESRIIAQLGLTPGRYILATVHRAENTDVPARLAAILCGLSQVGEELPVVLPIHPRTRRIVEEVPELGRLAARLRVIHPIGYLDMVMLEKSAKLIATDSGGVQKEAYFYGVPCVTLRPETEWIELIELGWNRLVDPLTPEHVAIGIRAALAAPAGRNASPYGTGTAARSIVDQLLRTGIVKAGT